MIRRRIVFIYWICAIVLLPKAAFAYIDPATTTYLIQIATALVVMIGVSLTVFLYRFRTISSKIKFWIYGIFYRNNRKKITDNQEKTITEYKLPDFAIPGADVSPDVSYFDNNVHEKLICSFNDLDLKKKGKSISIPQTYIGKLRFMIPLAAAFSFTFIIIGCLELAVLNSAEIPFRLSLIVPVVIVASIVFFVALILIIPVFSGFFYELLLALGLSILIAGYIQGNFLNFGIGKLTGDVVIWSDLKLQFFVSISAWIICFIIVFLIWRRNRKVWGSLIIFAPLLLILLQGVSLTSAIKDKTEGGIWGGGIFWQTADEALTIDRINQVAAEKNAIVIVLDRLDQNIVDEIFTEDPRFFDPLDGFIKFDDFTTNYGATFPSVTSILTGQRYLFDKPRARYFEYAWANAKFMHILNEKGVDIRLYMDRGSGYDNAKQLGGLASNVAVEQIEINERIALVKLLKLSGYRYAPMPLKQFFWLSAYEFVDSLELTDQNAPYIVNDFAYYERLRKTGLSFSDDEESFIYIHLLGAHAPYTMDENIQFNPDTTPVRQTKGAFRIVYEYLDQLKELGIYEDSFIVIMGDHGNFNDDQLTRDVRTGLFVKPSGSAGEPLQTSHAPVSPDQLFTTIIGDLFEDTTDYGYTFFNISEGDDIVRDYTTCRWRYEITGDGRDFSNWHLIGRFPDTYEP